MATFQDLYSNIFTYPLYIGICLLLMLVYSIIYMVLAVYIERINPGQFGVSQPFYYICYRRRKTSPEPPIVYSRDHNIRSTSRSHNKVCAEPNHWIEMDSTYNKTSNNPLLRIKHLTKVSYLITFLFCFFLLALSIEIRSINSCFRFFF